MHIYGRNRETHPVRLHRHIESSLNYSRAIMLPRSRYVTYAHRTFYPLYGAIIVTARFAEIQIFPILIIPAAFDRAYRWDD